METPAPRPVPKPGQFKPSFATTAKTLSESSKAASDAIKDLIKAADAPKTEKKPFVPKPHLTDRPFAGPLAELRKSMPEPKRRPVRRNPNKNTK